MGPICECGCGGFLPDGSTRRYKRGHKQRINGAPATARVTDKPHPFKQDESWIGDSIPEGSADRAFWEIDEQGDFLLTDAAAITPNDPDPLGSGFSDNKQPFEIKITAAIKRDIQGKLAFMMSMTANLWQMVDPICGTAMLDNTAEVSKALTPIICQSPAVVAWFRKASNFSLYMNLLMAVWPILATVYAHHLSKSISVESGMNGHVAHVPESAYGVS